jgi:DNA-binding PadR family transcriptional regulator
MKVCDDLVKKGLLKIHIDSDGEVYYSLTQKGRELAANPKFQQRVEEIKRKEKKEG